MPTGYSWWQIQNRIRQRLHITCRHNDPVFPSSTTRPQFSVVITGNPCANASSCVSGKAIGERGQNKHIGLPIPLRRAVAADRAVKCHVAWRGTTAPGQNSNRPDHIKMIFSRSQQSLLPPSNNESPCGC